MKTALRAFLLIFVISGYSQGYPPANLSYRDIDDVLNYEFPLNDVGMIEYGSVVQVPNVSKEELYEFARIWFVNSYRSAEDVLQHEDKESGLLIGKAYSNTPLTIRNVNTDVKLHYTISIAVKENRFKYRIYGLKYDGGGEIFQAEPILLEQINSLKKMMKDIAIGFRASTIMTMKELQMELELNFPESIDTDDDW